jgi:hypothetical protein
VDDKGERRVVSEPRLSPADDIAHGGETRYIDVNTQRRTPISYRGVRFVLRK